MFTEVFIEYKENTLKDHYLYTKCEYCDNAFEHKGQGQHPQGLVYAIPDHRTGCHRPERGLIELVGAVVPLVITKINRTHT